MSLRDELFKRRKKHRQFVLFVGLLVLFGLTTALALVFGMDAAAVAGFVVLFVVVGYVTALALEHH